jgi:hypothetical protein
MSVRKCKFTACSSFFKKVQAMNISVDAYYISKCRSLIEEKLGWGNSADWQNQDFEKLSERIFEETKVMLSNSTLKRIWGRVRYDSSPNRATLNSLAQFLGYANWLEFTKKNFKSEEIKPDNNPKKKLRLLAKNLILFALLIGVVIFIGFGLIKRPTKHLWFEELQFTSKPVTSGLPNTVVFKYNVTNSNADSVFIQQSWDPGKRFKVDKQLHEYTSTYYLPGYYRAKLILNDSIVKEHDVYVETKGWVGIIEKNPIPVYLSKGLFQDQSEMGISEKELQEQKIEFEKEVPVVTITKVDKSINVPSEHLSLTVQLRNTYNRSNGICRQTNVILFGTEGVIDIPLSNIGCVGEIGMMIGMKYIAGKTKDLSGFGVDFAKDVIVRCETADRVIKIFVNDKVAYTADFNQSIGRIVGSKIKFKGTGVVRHFELKEGK